MTTGRYSHRWGLERRPIAGGRLVESYKIGLHTLYFDLEASELDFSFALFYFIFICT